MVFSRINENIQTILDKDPAARTRLEVVLCYPGFHAITIHRYAHWLWRQQLYTAARFLSHVSRVLTGIEIHPGATIGHRVFIDHGMGVVIGETTIIGDDCVIYQGVTLGAGAAARMGPLTRGKKRHPTLGRGVVVGSGAEIQGDITVGDDARVASRSIVLKDVPANSVVVGVPGRVVIRDGQKVKSEVDPDIEAEAIKSLQARISRLEAELTQVKGGSAATTPTDEVDAAFAANTASAEGDSLDPVDVFLHGAGI
ncbi:MAG TPA: serine O-acetyltransferase [Planktothrix sp.]|jgi:serine O-acetyltransferase